MCMSNDVVIEGKIIYHCYGYCRDNADYLVCLPQYVLAQ